MSAPRRTTRAGRPMAVVVALAVVLGAAGCTDGGGQSSPELPAGTPETSSPPLSSYVGDETVLVPRDPCLEISADRVVETVGAEPESSLTWAPGERLPGTSEVADEHGCRHTAGSVSAAAWVFAAPTSAAQGRRLAREVTTGKCRRVAEAETFGEPGVAFTCGLNTGTSLTGMRGLVGETWVSCEVRGTDDLQQVADWCAAVLESLSAP